MAANIDELVKKLTLEEKVALMSGIDNWHTAAVVRCGIASGKVTDGPHGCRTVDDADTSRTIPATCFPTASVLAATWNTELIHRVGQALGEETRARGCFVLLGPCVNIHRTPLGGRNFESYSEDPYLSSRMAVAWITGVQRAGVGACIKHFALNNQEFDRMNVSVEIDERTVREIYLPSFEAAVKEADTWSVMCSYNRINGTYSADNHWLLTEVLKEEWGFDGLVMSDWFAVHSTVPAANSGLDLEMPGKPLWFGKKLLDAVREGEVPEARLDDAVRRLLAVLDRAGCLEEPLPVKNLDPDPAHVRLARETAAEAIVLLKNERNVLPLDMAKLKKLAVIGPNAAVASIQGGGSSQVVPYYGVSPLEALRQACPGVEIHYEPGCRNNVATLVLDAAAVAPAEGSSEHGLTGEYFANNDLAGEPALTRVDTTFDFQWFGDSSPLADAPDNEFSIRWSGIFRTTEAGTYTFGLGTTGMARLTLADKVVCSSWDKAPEGDVFRMEEIKGECELGSGKSYPMTIEYRRDPDAMAMMRGIRIGCDPPLPADALQRATIAAKEADAAVIFAGLTLEHESEGFDRETMDLPAVQVELIKKVAAANPNTVVVLNNGSPVTLDTWIHDVPAVLEAWFGGMEGGTAAAAVLTGEVNPSGKLPDTFPRRYEDNPSYGNYPGADGKVVYAEGVFVGYRHYDANGIEPSFPFGHGLSYTEFGYDNLRLGSPEIRAGQMVRVSIDITNRGMRPGKETVQVYVCDREAKVPRPPQELKAFAKIHLEPGERETVTLELDERALSFWDGGWTAEPGEFEVWVGSSSRDIRARASLVLRG